MSLSWPLTSCLVVRWRATQRCCSQASVLGDRLSLTFVLLLQHRLLELYSELAASQQAAAYQRCYTAALDNERRQVALSSVYQHDSPIARFVTSAPGKT